MTHNTYHTLSGLATRIPIPKPRPIISYSPIILSTPDRPAPLQLRVTFPAPSPSISSSPIPSNDKLPIILLSHGMGRSNWLNSMEGYAPLYEFWAAHGFAVILPTHMSSLFLGVKAPEGKEMWWQDRAEDMVRILDRREEVESRLEESVPGLKGRLDWERVAVAGHSLGGWTASMLLGASNTDPRTGETWYKPEPRIKAGVIMGGTGNGGSDMSEQGKTMVPWYGADFSKMQTNALSLHGDEDVNPYLTIRGSDWHADTYRCAPGAKDLLVLKGAKHGLGGISGWDAAEGDDGNPERLGLVQRMSLAYLRSQLFEGDKAWEEACKAFGEIDQGRVESKV